MNEMLHALGIRSPMVVFQESWSLHAYEGGCF